MLEEGEEVDEKLLNSRIHFRHQLKENMTTNSNPYGLESSTSCSAQCNEVGVTENKNLNNSHKRKRQT